MSFYLFFNWKHSNTPVFAHNWSPSSVENNTPVPNPHIRQWHQEMFLLLDHTKQHLESGHLFPAWILGFGIVLYIF